MQPKRIAVFVSGSGTNLQSLIDELSNYEYGKIELVFSNRKNAYALERAKKSGIKEVFLQKKDFTNDIEFDEALRQILEDNKIDLIVLAGYLRIITKALVDEYEHRIINIHPSLLPSFGGKGAYGIHVHEQVINKGCKVSGATVHFVDTGADTGPIIFQESLEVKQDWNAENLQEEVLKIEHRLLPKAVKYFCEDKLKVIDTRVFIKE